MDVSLRQNPAYRLSLALSLAVSRLVWVILLLLYAGAIFALSQTPVAPGKAPFPHADKAFHAAEFFAFAVLAWKASRGQGVRSFLLTGLYAGSDELHQLFVATRTASALDLAADLCGAGAALLFLSAARLWRLRGRRILRRTHTEVGS